MRNLFRKIVEKIKLFLLCKRIEKKLIASSSITEEELNILMSTQLKWNIQADKMK